MKKWIALMMLGFASSAMAADWVELGSDGEETLYGDVSSRTANRAWFLWDFKTPQRNSANKKFYKREKTLVEVSCADNQYRVLSIAQYSQSDQSVYSDSGVSEWDYIIPDSTGERVYNFVCHQDPR